MHLSDKYRVGATALNLRSRPTTGSAVLAVLPHASSVSIIETAHEDPGWVRVAAGGREGYVARRHLVPIGASPAMPGSAAKAMAPIDPTRRDTDPSRFHPRFRELVAAIEGRLAEEGIPLRVFEGYRPPERQAHLFAQGRSAPGRIVTYARPWESYHQYGLAADFVAYENDRWSWDDSGDRGQWWRRLHVIAREAGLEPLRFELPHVQLGGLTIGALRAGRFPDDGDASWRECMEGAIARCAGDPDAPPPMSVRPPVVA